jgi:Fic family protein
VSNKADYYRLLQLVRVENNWEDWVVYMLDAVENTAKQTIVKISQIKLALQQYKQQIRSKHKFYSQDLINNLFSHPYTKIEFIQRDLNVSRITATRYLDTLADDGFVKKQKLGRGNYYVNLALSSILTDKKS